MMAEELQLPLQLTHLSLDCCELESGSMTKLSQLSEFLDLSHLKLRYPAFEGLPDGMPSQLVKLTCLDISFEADGDT
jgi:hypothetical protein